MELLKMKNTMSEMTNIPAEMINRVDTVGKNFGLVNRARESMQNVVQSQTRANTQSTRASVTRGEYQPHSIFVPERRKARREAETHSLRNNGCKCLTFDGFIDLNNSVSPKKDKHKTITEKSPLTSLVFPLFLPWYVSLRNNFILVMFFFGFHISSIALYETLSFSLIHQNHCVPCLLKIFFPKGLCFYCIKLQP